MIPFGLPGKVASHAIGDKRQATLPLKRRTEQQAEEERLAAFPPIEPKTKHEHARKKENRQKSQA